MIIYHRELQKYRTIPSLWSSYARNSDNSAFEENIP
jgi:hypothetical protein